jgi:hypothetical protein
VAKGIDLTQAHGHFRGDGLSGSCPGSEVSFEEIILWFLISPFVDRIKSVFGLRQVCTESLFSGVRNSSRIATVGTP